MWGEEELEEYEAYSRSGISRRDYLKHGALLGGVVSTFGMGALMEKGDAGEFNDEGVFGDDTMDSEYADMLGRCEEAENAFETRYTGELVDTVDVDLSMPAVPGDEPSYWSRETYPAAITFELGDLPEDKITSLSTDIGTDRAKAIDTFYDFAYPAFEETMEQLQPYMVGVRMYTDEANSWSELMIEDAIDHVGIEVTVDNGTILEYAVSSKDALSVHHEEYASEALYESMEEHAETYLPILEHRGVSVR